MEWISKNTWEYKKQYKEQWHIWFAWHPVVVKIYPDSSVKYVWLKKVLRKGMFDIYSYDPFGPSWQYEYTEIKKEENNDRYNRQDEE